MKKSKTLLELFLAFLKIGAFTFGGGYAMIPVIQDAVCHEKGWLSDEEFLDSIYLAGVDFEGTEIEGRARSMERSKKMLDLVDSAVETIRQKNKNGELYYQVLYWNYLSPHEMANAEEIMEHLEEANIHITKRTMTTYRLEAINCVSTILWGYSSKECSEILSNFIRK